MKLHTFPASHQKHFELGVARLLREIQNDVAWRADEDVRIQRMAWIPSQLIDKTASGTVAVLVGPVNEPAGSLGDHLIAFASHTSQA